VPRIRPLFPVAVSIQGAADALKIPRRVVAEAAMLGELEAFSGPGRRARIPVESLVAWVKSWPRYSKERKPQ